jgi:hypothetical protein
VELYTIPNLAATEVKPAVPWEFEPHPIRATSKAMYKGWCNQSTTEHMFYNGWIGVAPNIRVSDQNMPHSVLALIADYDAVITDEELNGMRKRARSYMPMYVHRTPTSGGARLIWILERPVMVPSMRVAQRFLEKAGRALGMDGLLPGLDRGVWKNPRIYYDVGKEWMEVAGGEPISFVEALGWVVEASDKERNWQGDEMDLTLIAEEVEKRFPGRWTGPFELNSRSVRFWDAMADNPTAAIIRPTGMQCFTGNRPFVTWSEIFGPAFVERHQAEDLGRIINDVWFDGKSYWYQSENGDWESRAEKEMIRNLKVAHALSAERDDGRTHSQVDRALHIIDGTRRVAGAAPFLYKPPGMLQFMGRKVVNTARVATLVPNEDCAVWGEGFPWIAEFLEELFDPEEQLHWALAWLQRFYVSALEGKPRQGQAVFIHGPTGRGKTLFSNRIVSGLMGGHADASKFLLGTSEFNKQLFHVGLWTIDDVVPGSTQAEHIRFSAFLKKVAANTTFEYRAMWNDPVMVEWTGRVMVTGNLDAESMRILPDCDTSILDKLFFLKTSDRVRQFPDKHELEKTIARELPNFAGYLTHHEPDPEVISEDPRYGIKSYHHEELKDAAGEMTDSNTVGQILMSFMEDVIKDGRDYWEGTGIQLLQALFLDDSLRPLVSRASPRWINVQLGKLEAQGRSVKSVRKRGNLWWRIEHNGFKS